MKQLIVTAKTDAGHRISLREPRREGKLILPGDRMEGFGNADHLQALIVAGGQQVEVSFLAPQPGESLAEYCGNMAAMFAGLGLDAGAIKNADEALDAARIDIDAEEIEEAKN